jgi:hypothetical protein
MKIPRIILKSLYIDGEKFHQYQQNEEIDISVHGTFLESLQSFLEQK